MAAMDSAGAVSGGCTATDERSSLTCRRPEGFEAPLPGLVASRDPTGSPSSLSPGKQGQLLSIGSRVADGGHVCALVCVTESVDWVLRKCRAFVPIK